MKLRRALCFSVLLPWLLYGAYYTGTATITTSGTPVQASTASPAPPTSCVILTIQARTDTVGTLYVGGSNVSAANKLGATLSPGQTPPASATFPPSSTTALYSPQSIYVDSTSSMDKFNVLCYK